MGRKLIYFILFVGLTLVATIGFSQSGDGFFYLEKYNQRMDSIKNYSSTFTIRTDIKSLDVPDVTGKMFFKSPAHYSIAIDGFAVLPKHKLTPLARFLSRSDFKALMISTEKVNGRLCQVIELTPVDTASLIDHYTIWVDKKVFVVRRMLMIEKDKSEFMYHYTYKTNSDLLPVKLTYTFEYTNKNAGSVLYNQLWHERKPAEPLLVKGNLIIEFQYYDVRREGDK